MSQPERKRFSTLDRVMRVGAVLGTVVLAFRFGQVAMQPGRQLAGLDDGRIGRGEPSTPASGPARRAGHETQEMSGWLMFRLGLMLMTIALVVVGGMIGLRSWVTHSYASNQPRFTALQTAPVQPPAPGLQANPDEEWHQVRAKAEALLDNYAWVDGTHARARIPIDRAMALTVGQGLEPPP